MSVPKLTTSDGTTYTVTFTKGHEFPWPNYYNVDTMGNQDLERTRDGFPVVRKNGDAVTDIYIHIDEETESVGQGVFILFSSLYVLDILQAGFFCYF